ncbi:hypothetical protein [Pseudodesulfovibrio sediminis]|uniref:Internal virion protein C n=1 Tax=Pseudodesulfovibrio sediminis TaxID=2810563 RepID=A0ABM7P3D8_9BACT|nr:hypothetical protein [Pseudodesulfovibrio sediminis]BCS87328.1 hypothetical protein PSDVSF_05700 [Pseudodesulfovibrio sediminis]
MELKKFTAGGLKLTGTARQAMPRTIGADAVGNEMRRMALNMSASQDEDDYHSGVLAFAKGVNALDAEFDKDEDLATLGERRAEKVKGLAESLYEGKSSRVQEKLRERFDLAAESDGVKWKAIVTKKDSANRVARFNEDLDPYMNHMIQAKTDQDYANAKAMWNGRLAAIQPHMSKGQFAQVRERVNDTVQYQRAWNATTGEGAFDPTPFMDLSPAQVGQLEARHHVLKREKARRVAEYQNDRANALIPLLEDSAASAMQTGVTMDGTKEMLAELSGLGERGAEIADKYRARFERTGTVWNTLDAVKFSPHAEQMAAVETLRPEPGTPGYRADMDMYQHAAQIVVQNAKAFQADPAGFVRADAENRARNAASPMREESLEPLVIQASMEMQRELGNAEPKLLTMAQAKGLKDQFERADGDGKAQILQGLTTTYGKFDGKALEELGLDHADAYAAELYNGDSLLGRNILQAMSLKNEDIVISPETRKSVKQEVEDAYFNGPGAYFQKQYELTANPQYQHMNKELLAATMKYGMVIGNGTKAVEEMWGKQVDFVFSDDMQISAPVEVNTDELKLSLRNWRWSLPYDNTFRRAGVWVNSSDRTGFLLALPTGEIMKEKEGNPIVVTYEDLIKFERNEHERERLATKNRPTRDDVRW